VRLWQWFFAASLFSFLGSIVTQRNIDAIGKLRGRGCDRAESRNKYHGMASFWKQIWTIAINRQLTVVTDNRSRKISESRIFKVCEG
jgi:hypothetical protein